LHNRAFRRLWFIQAATQVGGNMLLYALTILVFTTTRSNTAVSTLLMSFLVPPVLLSALAGVFVERIDARVAMIVPNAVRMALTLGLALAGANVGLLLALNLSVSLTIVFLTPAEAMMIPRIVPRDQLETAMGISSLTLQASFALGFALLGPILVVIAGPSFVLAVVAALYAAATIVALFLPAAPTLAAQQGPAGQALAKVVRQFREGLAAISGNREVSRPLLILSVAASLVGVLGVLTPNLATSLDLDPKNLIIIVAPLGAGVVAGVFGLRRWGGRRSRRRVGEGGLVVFGSLVLIIAFCPLLGHLSGVSSVPLVMVLAFASGAAYAATNVSAQTALFEHMPAAVRGRIFGILASIVSAASLFPILLAGPLADAVGGPAVIAASAILVVVLALWAARAKGIGSSPTQSDLV
jgi:MFS family permease